MSTSSMWIAKLVRSQTLCEVNINNASIRRHVSSTTTMDKARVENFKRTSSSMEEKAAERSSGKNTDLNAMSSPAMSPLYIPTTITSERVYSAMGARRSLFSSRDFTPTMSMQKNSNALTASDTTPATKLSSTSPTLAKRHQSKDSSKSMDDEYGTMEASGKIYTHPTPYQLESFGMFGHYTSTNSDKIPRGVLNPAFLNYNTYGSLNAERDNVIVICHALTGNASLEAWWGELLGRGKAFDTDRYFIVCANILGSCYGSCGPSSLRPGCNDEEQNISMSPSSSTKITAAVPRDKTNRPIYGIDFPDVSVRDTVRLQLLMLKNELKIKSIKCVIGGSFGGMQVMEYCAMAGATRPIGEVTTSTGGGDMMMIQNDLGGIPYGIGEFVSKRNGRIEPYVRSAVPIACGAAHTAWQIAISETQRQAIYADPKWNNGRIDANDPPNSGLSVARQIGMVSYRTPLGYQKKFGRALTDESGPSYGQHAPWQVKSYLEYQGRKFLDRFDPVTYVKLTEQMDSHDISRGRGSMDQVLSQIEIPVCVLGIDSDVLYPLHEQEELARLMPNAELKIIHSGAGHDGFLLEQDQVAAHIKSFLYSHD